MMRWIPTLACLLSLPLHAQTIAIRNVRILPVGAPPIEAGTLVMRDGTISAIGVNATVPAGATVIDGRGMAVMPGLIDAMTYFGLASGDVDETADPINPQIDILDAYSPLGPEFARSGGALMARELLSGGVTTQYIGPGDGTVIGGQGAVVKTWAPSHDRLVVRRHAAIDMDLSGTAVGKFRSRQRSPSTRPMQIALVRQALVRAQEYMRNHESYAARPSAERARSAPPSRDLGNEALVRLLKREIPARIQANRATDIRAAMALAKEFGFDVIIDGGGAAHQLAGELRASNIRVVVGPVTNADRKLGYWDDPDGGGPPELNTARLVRAGIPVAIASFSRDVGAIAADATAGRFLLKDAAVASGYGLTDDEVLAAVTLRPAQILGIDDRVGSLAVGKDADVIMLDGDPLKVKTSVQRVFVGGVEVWRKQ